MATISRNDPYTNNGEGSNSENWRKPIREEQWLKITCLC